MLSQNGYGREPQECKLQTSIFHEESADFIKLINYYNSVYKIRLMQNPALTIQCVAPGIIWR